MGLTGGVASGKSTVAAILAELGAVVVDADLLAREVVEPGTPGLAAVVEAFGPDVLAEDGCAGPAGARRRGVRRPGGPAALEAILHPLIRARGAELEAAAPEGAVVVHDIPLLAENGQADRFEAVLVVDVPVETQVQRMVADRGMDREDALARVAAQATREERLAVATYVMENTGTREDLRDRVTEVFELLGGSRPGAERACLRRPTDPARAEGPAERSVGAVRRPGRGRPACAASAAPRARAGAPARRRCRAWRRCRRACADARRPGRSATG